MNYRVPIPGNLCLIFANYITKNNIVNKKTITSIPCNICRNSLGTSNIQFCTNL